MTRSLVISASAALAARSQVERMTGIEPALSAWEADVLPLNYIRVLASSGGGLALLPHRTGTGRLVGAPAPIVVLAGPPGPVRLTRRARRPGGYCSESKPPSLAAARNEVHEVTG